MQVSSDYKDIFKTFNRYKVRYLVVGAYAVTYYTEPRFTKDLDIWVEPEKKNAQKVYNALKDFGAPLKSISPDDFTKKKLIYQIGIAPIRIDIIMSLANLDFSKSWSSRKKIKFDRVAVNIIGINELIVSKKRSKRPQDKLDLKRLKRQKH